MVTHSETRTIIEGNKVTDIIPIKVVYLYIIYSIYMICPAKSFALFLICYCYLVLH